MACLRSQSWKATEVGCKSQLASLCPLQCSAEVMEMDPGESRQEPRPARLSPQIHHTGQFYSHRLEGNRCLFCQQKGILKLVASV